MSRARERRMGTAAVSPREAVFVTGLSEKTINQAIDRNEVETLPPRREDDHDRLLGFSDLVYLRLRDSIGRLLSPEGKRMLREQLAEARGVPVEAVSLGPLELAVAPASETVRERLARIEDARSFVAVNPEVRGGEPVVRGTRIPVSMLADLERQGALPEELLEDYPSLTPESLEAALVYARLYPRRGRPRRTPWQ
ncbi:MAG TPA: DUF433 domain-containing protein, partial [Longimicrobiaceae bacterium]|nr:DUF433 domain-containing protein [Longimicrobiaceae bacterium]